MSEYGRQDWSKVSANPIVDWGGLAKGFSEQLAAQAANRDAQRKKIDDDAAAQLTKLQDYTVGSDENANAFLTGSADNATSALKAQWDQVKKGQADPRQFQLMLKNMQDTFNSVKKIADNKNAMVKQLNERTNTGINSNAEIKLAKTYSGFEDLSKTKLVPDKNGVGWLYNIDDSGNIIEGTQRTPSSLLNPANHLIDKVFVDKEIDPVAKNVADWVTNLNTSTGQTMNDPRQHPGYENFVNGAVKNVLSTPMRRVSVLVDSMGYGVATTEQEHKDNPDAIYLKMEKGLLTPQFTDDQLKKSEQYVSDSLNAKVKKEFDQKWQPERPQIVKAPEGEKGPKVDKQKEPYVAEKLSYINETPINSVTKKPTGKRKNVGYVVGVSNVKINQAPGVDEVINGFGIKNGKFFIKYVQYTGKESLKGTGYSETNVIKTPKTIYDDLNNGEIEAKIKLIPNPYTGENFHSSDEAKQYMNMLKGGNSKYMG